MANRLRWSWFLFLTASLLFPALAMANLGPPTRRIGNMTLKMVKNPSTSTSVELFPIVQWRGKAIALMFWKVGDSQSEAAAKAFEKIAKIYKGKLHFATGVKASTTPDIKKAQARAKKLGLQLPMFFDRSQISGDIGAWYNFPRFGIIDKKGYIRVWNCGSLTEMAGPNVNILKAIQMAAAGKKLPTARCLGRPKKINSHALVGKRVPNVGLDDEKGKSKTARKMLNKKPTLILFWSATSDHCKRIVPLVAKYWRARKGNIDMLSITRAPSQELKDMIKKLFKEKGVKWPVAYAPENATLSFFNIVKVPTVFLLDKNGVIRHTWIQPEKWVVRSIEAALFHYKMF